jgi:xanthine/uracil permease
MLILLGLFGKFGALAAAIPTPVVGGLYCAMFGLISAVGIRQFARADLASDRNLFIGGFALFMGISVPYYFANGGSESVTATFWSGLDDVINAIGGTGMAVAAILGIVLDNVIPGTNQERGLQPLADPPLSGNLKATAHVGDAGDNDAGDTQQRTFPTGDS